jgi:hypothetical protein
MQLLYALGNQNQTNNLCCCNICFIVVVLVPNSKYLSDICTVYMLSMYYICGVRVVVNKYHMCMCEQAYAYTMHIQIVFWNVDVYWLWVYMGVRACSVTSDSLWPLGLQPARLGTGNKYPKFILWNHSRQFGKGEYGLVWLDISDAGWSTGSQ